MIISYTVSEIWYVTNAIFIFILGLLFALLPLTVQKAKFFKNEKLPGDTIIYHMCTKNYDQMMYSP